MFSNNYEFTCPFPPITVPRSLLSYNSLFEAYTREPVTQLAVPTC